MLLTTVLSNPAPPAFDIVGIVTEGVSNISGQVMSLVPIIGGAALLIAGGFIGIRLAVRAFNRLG